MSTAELRRTAAIVIGHHKSLWFFVAGNTWVHRLTEMVVTELLIIRHENYEQDVAAKLVRVRIRARLKVRRPKINPILMFVLMQVVSVIARILIQRWWEKWKENHA